MTTMRERIARVLDKADIHSLGWNERATDAVLDVVTPLDLRLECARLVSVFTEGGGDQIAQTDRLFRYIKEGVAND